MAMLDSFFKQRFNAAKCKTLLKLTIPRIKLLRNRREIQLKQMRREIAQLLETGQEATARIRVEHIIREEKMMAAQEIVELFCELISVRLPIIEAQRECPLDLKEAIASICFAAPRCADLTELLQVQMLFAGKYGKEFVAAATELRPECGVNRQVVELLSIRAPTPDEKLKLLKEIAEEHELDWDASASENELLKRHEDLLNGPTQFVRGAKLPLPEEKHDEPVSVASEPPAHEHSDSDEDFDIIDLPEVPKQPLQSRDKKDGPSVPEMLPFPASAMSEVDDQEESTPFGGNQSPSHLEAEDVLSKNSVPEDPSPKQFVPFISPHPQSPVSVPAKGPNPPPSISEIKDEDNMDLQDVLAAAQAAADSAERAATAARSAASIAQLRISELVKRKSSDEKKTSSGELHLAGDLDSALASPSHHNGFGNDMNRNEPTAPNLSPASSNVLSPGNSPHQPQRLSSMDDESYFSYPNLFTHGHSSFNDSK